MKWLLRTPECPAGQFWKREPRDPQLKAARLDVLRNDARFLIPANVSHRHQVVPFGGTLEG